MGLAHSFKFILLLDLIFSKGVKKPRLFCLLILSVVTMLASGRLFFTFTHTMPNGKVHCGPNHVPLYFSCQLSS